MPAVTDELAAELPYTCDSAPFDVRVFSLPADAEREAHPSAAGLDAAAELMGYAAVGWWLVHRTASEAHYITQGGEQGFRYLKLGPTEGGRWEFKGGGDCRVQYQQPGRATVTWWLDPDAGAPRPNAREVEVTAIDPCISDPLRPWLQEPVLRYGAEAILLILTATFGDAVGDTCARAQPVGVRIGLDEPLGDRELVDGSRWPARDGTVVPEF